MEIIMKKRILIGVDPGTVTGYAIKNLETGLFEEIGSAGIIMAMEILETYSEDCFVIIEDARLWNGVSKGMKSGTLKAKALGAGSVKRDCSIWEEHMKHWGIDFKMVPPSWKGAKVDAKMFKMITGWNDRTNAHGRDAAMLIHAIDSIWVEKYLQIEYSN